MSSSLFGLLLLGTTGEDAQRWSLISPDADRLVRVARACLEFNPPHLETIEQLGIGALKRTTSAYAAAVRALAHYAQETVPYEVDRGHAEMERLLYNAPAPERNHETAAYCLLALIEARAGVLFRRQLRLAAVNYNAGAESAADLSDRAIFLLFSQRCEQLPVFHTDSGTKAWLLNVASALLRAALRSQAYDCIAALLDEPMFMAALPCSELDQLQETCCKSLLSIRSVQRSSPQDTLLFLSESQAERIHALTSEAREVAQTSRELLITLKSVEQLMRMRESAEASAPGKGREQLVEQLPDVHVQRTAALLEIAADRRTQVAGAIQALGSRLQQALAALPPTDKLTEALRATEAYAKQLFDRIPLDQPLEPSADFVLQKDAPDPRWPFGQAMTALHELLGSGQCSAEEGAPLWLHISVLQTLYRYYALIAHPEEYAARHQLSEARGAAKARKYEESDRALEEIAGRIRAISFAAYIGDDDDDDN